MYVYNLEQLQKSSYIKKDSERKYSRGEVVGHGCFKGEMRINRCIGLFLERDKKGIDMGREE